MQENVIANVYEWMIQYADYGGMFMLYAIVLNVWSFLGYWIVGLGFIWLDITTPEWAAKYKIQPGTNQPVNRERLIHAVKKVLFNQVVIGGLSICLFGMVATWRGCPYKMEDLPGISKIISDIIIILACEEIGFFYSHKWFHDYPSLYKSFHKIHHEWTSPISITALYSHPLEHFWANLLPVALGPLVSGCHFGVTLVWVFMAQTVTLGSHSGYHFPFMSSPEAHDFHHLKFNVNYGVLGILDHLYGTDAKFLEDVASQRHHTYFSFTPIREQYPDAPKKKI